MANSVVEDIVKWTNLNSIIFLIIMGMGKFLNKISSMIMRGAQIYGDAMTYYKYKYW